MTMMGALRMVAMALIWLGTLAAMGGLAYYRLKDWRAFSGLVRVRRVRDVVFGSILIMIAASFANIVASAALHE